MKKKLLTVLLAVVMVFGVFGLTACGGSNADEDYNYYGIKYELEDEVKIEAVTFQGVYRMFTTAGRFLLYVDSETSASTQANFQAINKLANDWDVTIYHFNPDLTGGYAKTATTANANVIKVTENDTTNIKTIRSYLEKISNTTIDKWSDSSLVGIVGGASTVSNGALKHNGSIAASNPVADAAKSIAAVCQARVESATAQKPSYGAYTDAKKDIPVVPEAYITSCINTMNTFADARLHMYDDAGILTAEKEDVYVTVANYAMFAHLMDYNEGYFPVFFGGTWCPNTQAIAKETDKLAKDYGIKKIYFFDPKLADGTTADSVTSTTTWSAEQKSADIEAAYQAWETAKAAAKAAADDLVAAKGTEYAKLDAAAKAALKAYNDAVTAADKALKDAQDKVVYAQIAEDELAANATQAQKDAAAKAIKDAEDAVKKVSDDNKKALDKAQEKLDEANDAVADYVAAVTAYEAAYDAYVAEYAFNTVDAKFVNGKVVAQFEAAAKAETNKDAKAAAEALVAGVKSVIADADVMATLTKASSDKATAADKAEDAYEDAKVNGGYVTEYSVVLNGDRALNSFNTRDNDSSCEWAYAYASFLDNYLDTYQSEWNITAKLVIGGKDYTRMCVPNMMMFNGEEEGKAELVALAEAEYQYAHVDEAGSPHNVAWTEAVKNVFDANPYATYVPVVAAPEAAAPEASAPAAGGSSAPAASAGGDAC